MPFSGERAASDLAEWVRGVPLLGLLIDNVLLAAIFITAVAVIVVMATYWYQPASSGGWRARLRVAIYTFHAVSALLFIPHHGVFAKQSEYVRGGRAMHTFVGAMEGKPRYQSENLRDLIVKTGGRGDASESSRPGSDDSESESDGSESDSDSDVGSHRPRKPLAPPASAVTTPLVAEFEFAQTRSVPHGALAPQRPHPTAPVAAPAAAPAAVPVAVQPTVSAAAPMVVPMATGGAALGVPPVTQAVDWRTGVHPLPVVPQYTI